MMYKQGEILLIPIPFSDLSSMKKRPVLVLSNDFYNEKTDDILVAAITSNITSKEYSIIFSQNDLESGELKLESSIRVDKIYSLSQTIVISKFGKVKDCIISNVKEKLSELI